MDKDSESVTGSPEEIDLDLYALIKRQISVVGVLCEKLEQRLCQLAFFSLFKIL